MSWYVTVSSPSDDHRWRNARPQPQFHRLPLLRPSLAIQWWQVDGIKFPCPWECFPYCSHARKGRNVDQTPVRARFRLSTAMFEPPLAWVPKFQGPLTFLCRRVRPIGPPCLVIGLWLFPTERERRRTRGKEREGKKENGVATCTTKNGQFKNLSKIII